MKLSSQEAIWINFHKLSKFGLQLDAKKSNYIVNIFEEKSGHEVPLFFRLIRKNDKRNTGSL